MAKIDALLAKRLAEKDSSKMTQLAQLSTSGNRSSFAGIFQAVELNAGEKEKIEAILHQFTTGSQNIEEDLRHLFVISSEIKAINHQAALLHGERIQKVQEILTNYQEGAFTAWLMATYGNRQTPYNFLHYYIFYTSMPEPLRQQIETMPRQAVYTLASREGSLQKKRHIVETYKGGTKEALLHQIRHEFPLPEADGRKADPGEKLIQGLQRLLAGKQLIKLTRNQKKRLHGLIDLLIELIEES